MREAVKSLEKTLIMLVVLFSIGVAVFYVADKKLHLNQFSYIESKVKNALGINGGGDNNVTTKDTPLEVNIDETEHEVLESWSSIIVQSNKKISVEQSNRINLIPITQKDGTYYYVAEISNIGLGESKVKLTLVGDGENDSKDIFASFNKLTFTLPFGLDRIASWKDSTYEIDGNNLLAKVNKSSRLTVDYAPTDLKDLNKDYLLYTNAAGIKLRVEAADNLKIMLNQLKKETGKNVVIASGYRSYDDQVKTYNSWLKSEGQENADKVSARPGYSEHQLGTAIDFINQESGFDFTSKFDSTAAGKWLKTNSFNYGFVQSYPEGKESVTGYNYEAWHYRYIGIDNAKKMHDEGKTLIEFVNGR